MIYSARLNERVAQLKSLQKTIIEIKDIINYSCIEAKDIIKNIRTKHPEFFNGALHKNDQTVLNDLVSGIGKTDTEGQLQFCDRLIRNIDRNLEEAQNDKNEKAKLYATLGLSLGIAVSIIII